jgi:hypothetical protein
MKIRFVFTLMDKAAAEMIQTWRYEGAYAVYNMGSDEEGLVELLDRRSPYYSVRDEQGELVGFFFTWNKRAIRVYEQAGFQSVRIFLQHNIHGAHEFLEMRRDV